MPKRLESSLDAEVGMSFIVKCGFGSEVDCSVWGGWMVVLDMPKNFDSRV